MKPARPPRLTRQALRWLLPNRTRDEVLADLDDIWFEKSGREGRRTADRWYRGQAVKAVIPTLGAGPTDARRGREGRVDALRRDVGHAITQLRRHPGVGIVVVATLALGIGATTAIFSAVHATLLTPLPYSMPGDLVMVTTESGGFAQTRYLSGPDAADIERMAGTLSDVAHFLEATVGPLTQVDRPEHILTTPVTWNAFALLGVTMALGRSFNPDDAVPVPESSVEPPPLSGVISHDFWVRSFGADPDVIGTVVHVWGGATEIVGVLPDGFRFVLPRELNLPANGDMWRVIRSDYAGWSREERSMRTVARLSAGGSPRRAQQELAGIAEVLRTTHPHHAAERTQIRVASLESAVAAPMKGPLGLLMGAVALVLLIACANVANLLLARSTVRSGEMAVRSCLGAGAGRLTRQLVTESAILATAGAIGGVLLARGGVELLHRIRPEELYRLEGVGLDMPVLAFTMLVTTGATVLAGLLPALHTARSALADRFGGRGAIARQDRSRTILVVAEVALSVMLLAGAALLVRTFGELQRMPLGFEPEQVLTVTATQTSRSREERQAYEAELLRAAKTVAGVTSAGIVFPLPMNGVYDRSAEYAMEGLESDPGAWTTAYFRTINPTYFETVGLDLKIGRPFVSDDENDSVPTVVIDERLAEREFAGRNPVGEPLWVRGMTSDAMRAEIVGVVEYAPQWDHRDTRPTMYFPRVFYQSHEVSLVARVAGDASRVGPALSRAIRAVDPTFPSDMVPMERYVRERLAQSRFLLILMQIFAALALVLSAVGLYAVLSYSVRRRTSELGLRLALGAEGKALTRDIVLSGLRLAGLGVVAGLVGSIVVGQALRAQLFRVGSTDPVALTATAVMVMAVALAASLVPGMRAARIDPAVALQEE